MTQITIPDEAIEVTYNVSGSTTGPFTVPFSFLKDTDILVTITDILDAETVLVHSSGFTFDSHDTPPGQEGSGFNGGVISLVSSVGADGDTDVKIIRSSIIDRTNNYPTTGPFSMPLLNDELNKFIAIMQELLEGQAGGTGGIPTLQAVTAAGKTSNIGIELKTGAEFSQADSTDAAIVSFEWDGLDYETNFVGVGKWIIGAGLSVSSGAVRFNCNVEFALSGGGITTYFDNGLGAWVTLNQVGDDFVIRAGLGTSKNIHLIPISGGIVRIDSAISIKEIISAPSDIADYGQLWIRALVPNVPVFTDDTGVDQIIDPSISEINVQNGNYTTVIGDKGKTISKESGDAGETFTIDSHANVPYKNGTFIAFNNDGGDDLTIAITSDTLVWADDNSTGSRTLADGGYAVAQKVAQTTWKIAGKQLT